MEYRIEYLPDGENGQKVVISARSYADIAPSVVAIRGLELTYKIVKVTEEGHRETIESGNT